VRDYDKVPRAQGSTHSYGERTRDGRKFSSRQEWTWLDSTRYRTTFVVEEHDGTGWAEVIRTEAVYYAIPVHHLLQLMREAGFESCALAEVPFYQPMLTGVRPSP
jgi:hypothetical protein